MKKLSFGIDLEDKEILKALCRANHKLGELNGIAKSMPNPPIVLNAITIGEAKESSEIENIVTTYDEIYRQIILQENNPSAKEVVSYRRAILEGANMVEENGYISTNMLLDIHHIIEPNVGGIRKVPGTVIMNTATGEVMHTPPQAEGEILDLLSNLEKYINYPELEDVDPLIKMALIHYQFESIHPFYDGNGRCGRILCILYLMLEKRLCTPILYLSKYINSNRNQYYKLLQKARKSEEGLKEYVLYMIRGVEKTCEFTIDLITDFNKALEATRNIIEEKLPAIYSDALVEYLFYEFCTKNEYLCKNLGISRNTASKYLKALCEVGVLIEEKVGKAKIYKNSFLVYCIERKYNKRNIIDNQKAIK